MATYIQIENKVLTTSTASVTFSSIPQTYTDLKLVWSTRTPNTTPTTDNMVFRLNGATTNGTNRILYSTNGTSALSYADTATYTSAGTVGSAATASTFSNGELYIPNYASTTTFKSFSVDTVTENNGTVSGLALGAMLWSQNTAVTSIELVPNFANFSQYSSFTLYGISKS
jgi:hypothetical protein